MPDLLADELSFDHRELVQRHVAESFAHHQSLSFDDSLRRSQHTLRGRHSMPAVVRLSSDSTAQFSSSGQFSSSMRLSSFGMNPGHEVTDTSIRFLGVTRVDKHCEFRLQVDTGRDQYLLQKRYSQFRDLRQQLLIDGRAAAVKGQKPHGQCRNGACLQLAQQLAAMKFPRRKLRIKLHRDDDVRVARERTAQLQHFIELILAVYRTAPKRQVRCCVNAQCRVLKAIRAFLEIKDTEYDQLPDWKAASQGSNTTDEVPILDTPPSTSSVPSPLREAINDSVRSSDSPQPSRTSAMCLEELYTITEDPEHPHA